MDLITKGRVSVFHYGIEIDDNLPKFKKENLNKKIEIETLRKMEGYIRDIINDDSTKFMYGIDGDFLTTGDTLTVRNISTYTKIEETPKKGFISKLIELIKDGGEEKKRQKMKHDEEKERERIRLKEEAEESARMNPSDFFMSLKTKMTESELKDYSKSMLMYVSEYNKAKKMGQTALCEHLRQNIEMMRNEAILGAKNVKFLSETDLVQLGINTKRGIKIHYIKNFGRLIPDEVLKAKAEADSYFVYDNYVVVHFDPEDKAGKKTQKEIAKEKDPILFGVVNGSTNLYYVSDWVDEYCDLTLEKAMEIIHSKD